MHYFAITADGAVWSWAGEARAGWATACTAGPAAAHQRTSGLSHPPKKVEAFAGQRTVSVSAGEDHSLAITGDGAVFTWGAGDI